MFKLSRVLFVLAGLTMIALPAQAYEKGDWVVRVGGGMVDPKSDNSIAADVDDGSSLIFNGTYFFTPNLGFEVLAALPFSHDIILNADGSKAGETKHLPPTFSLQYHFIPDGAFRPYVGAGLNYTIFFDEETTGALTGVDLSLDDSIGYALQVGSDFDLSEKLFLNVDIRYINIETETNLGFDVEIDPMVYSIALGWKF